MRQNLSIRNLVLNRNFSWSWQKEYFDIIPVLQNHAEDLIFHLTIIQSNLFYSFYVHDSANQFLGREQKFQVWIPGPAINKVMDLNNTNYIFLEVKPENSIFSSNFALVYGIFQVFVNYICFLWFGMNLLIEILNFLKFNIISIYKNSVVFYKLKNN